MTLTDLVGEGREEAALESGCLRVREFIAVQAHRPRDEQRAAVNVVFDHLGLNVHALTNIAQFAEKHLTPESETAFLLGLMVGLYAIDYET